MRIPTRLVTACAAVLGVAVVQAVFAVQTIAAPGAGGISDTDWSLTTTAYAPSGQGGYVPAYLGNGYFSARVPAQGTGFATAPVTTESQLAGFYGQGPGTTIQRANLPAWTELGFSDGSGTFGTVPATTVCAFGRYCEAETGTLSGAAKIATDHTGFGGTGFVAGFAANGNQPQRGASDTLQFTAPAAGPAALVVRYAAGLNNSAQSLSASVNGGSPMRLTLPGNSNWNAWQTTTLPVSVAAGRNTVSILCGATDTCVANVDSFALVDTGQTPTPSVAADPGTVSDYRQTLDLHEGTITTTLTWTSPAGRATRLSYEVMVSEADMHVAAVRMTAQPLGWSGAAAVTDVLDGRANTLPVSHRTPAAINLTTVSDRNLDAAAHRISENLATVGLGMTAALASTLVVDGSDSPTGAVDLSDPQSLGQRADMDLADGQTFTITKYVGIASGTDTADGSSPLAVSPVAPGTAATQASADAAEQGWDTLMNAHRAAWAQLWQSDISVPGDSALTLRARASMFNLLQSTRDGVDWSMSPGGLSSAEYNGHIFWDAETWMYPALLAAHPQLAKGMNDYRSLLLSAATSNAASNGMQGAQFPWESAQSGADVGIHPREVHINGDVALAQWDYYQATGDLDWLRTTGWPVLQSVAQYWTSRVTPDGAGGYDLNGVQGPDENHDNVDNSSYTNVSAITSLQIAQQAAALVGAPIDPRWSAIAAGLARSIPTDPATGRHLEFDNYKGDSINQADVVMMQYPWNYPMSKQVAQADLDYYTPRTLLTGPAMTDSINMIDTAALSTPGCSAYTYFQRSTDPYVAGPLDQFSEHLGATGVIDFTTGIGGFMQELYYGLTGLRWGTDAVTLDPMLPPQLPGLHLTGLHWQGRVFGIDISPDTTTVTLERGKPLPVVLAGRAATVSHRDPLVASTRRPDLVPTDDHARCASVSATSADLSYPATAAVDGADATSWKPTVAGAALTIDLASNHPVRRVQVLSATGATTAYSIDISADGSTWTPLGSVPAGSDAISAVTPPTPATARYVRYTAAAGVKPSVSSLTVLAETPAPTITSPTDGADLRAAPTAVRGTAVAGTEITVHDGAATVCTTITDTDTTWVCAPTSPLRPGRHVLTATADAAGTTSDASLPVSVTVDPGAAPTATTLPQISGAPIVGATLTATPGTWSADGLTFDYQWLSAGRPIDGATGPTYTLSPADVGSQIIVTVTAHQVDHADGTATSAPTDPIRPTPDGRRT